MEPSGYYNDMLHETRTLSDIAVNWVLFCIKQEEIFMCFIQTTVKNKGFFFEFQNLFMQCFC